MTTHPDYQARLTASCFIRSMTDTRYYAGIGSRETPTELIPAIHRIAKRLHDIGFTLRSGGAPGADTFFEQAAGDKKEIFLPWKGFNDNPSPLYQPLPESYKIASKYHPAWHKLKRGARSLMARNSHQVLGPDLDSPIEFVLCWTKDGKATGGTGQALRMAAAMDIPVFNFYFGTRHVIDGLTGHFERFPY